MLALAGLLAAGAFVPSGALAQAERLHLAAMGAICLAGGGDEPAPAGHHSHHDAACCISCLTALAPTPLPLAVPALPAPSAGPVLRAAVPPPPRAPPPLPAHPFQPRGPPVPA